MSARMGVKLRPHYTAEQLREMVGHIDGGMPDRPNYAPGKCAWCNGDAEYRAVSSDRKWVWPSCGLHSFDNTGVAS